MEYTAIAIIYAKLIMANVKEINDVPPTLKEEVVTILNDKLFEENKA